MGPLMTTVFKWSRATSLALMIGTTSATAARAQSADDFYRSKQQLSIIVPTAPGGGYDSYARMLARHMSKYIPGRPSIVASNMPGGGGIGAANYLYNVAPKDGATFGILDRGSPTAPLLYGEASKAQFEATKFSWIGSAMSETGMGVVAANAPATTIEEAKSHELFFGATGPETDPAMDARLMNDMLGTKIKVINGYKGQPEEFLAVEKGEIQGLFMSGWSGPGRAYVREQIGKGKLKLLVQMSTVRDPLHQDTPTILDVTPPADRPMVEMLLARLELGRPFVAPPGVPADRLEVLRTAFRKAMEDPELLADAAAQKLAVHPTWGAEAQALVDKMYRTPPDLMERVKKIVRVSD